MVYLGSKIINNLHKVRPYNSFNDLSSSERLPQKEDNDVPSFCGATA